MCLEKGKEKGEGGLPIAEGAIQTDSEEAGELAMWLSGRNVFQAEATACAKALRQECASGQRGCNWVHGGECCRR